MESNESEDTKLSKPNLSDSCAESLKASQALLHNLLENAETDPALSDKETQNDKADNGSTSKSNAKDSPETEKPKSIFHLSDNMKKDLSMLTFPSKTSSRKKGVISSRAIPVSRITIGEALEKAEDARKCISKLHVTSDAADVKGKGISELPSHFNSHDKVEDERDQESQDMARLLPHNDTPETSRKKGKKVNTAVSSQGVGDGSSTSGASVNNSASCSEGKTGSLAGKSKSPGASRIQMTRRMWELLKFTFIHEHFPSSVHMARLGKMMGIPWSQIRNWFTDRRVDNKKAGIYPRDRPLTDCPYCDVTLKTEAESKSHLFSTQHVKRILGPEYCGGRTAESIKWKKLPRTVNAVSKVSGARILAVGFSAEDSKKGKKVQEQPKMEAAVEKAPHSKELKKLWTEAMLQPEEKEQALVDWEPVRVSVERNSESQNEPDVQGKKETILNVKMQDPKEKVSEHKCQENLYSGKISRRPVAIPGNVVDIIPDNVSDDFPLIMKNATAASKTGKARSYPSDPVRISVVPSVIPGDSHVKKRHQTEDIAFITELKTTKKNATYGRKLIIGSRLEPSGESQRPSILPAVRQRAHKGTARKSTSSASGLISLPNISREKKYARPSLPPSQCMQDFELKQEPDSDESRKNNIVLYKGDGSSGQSKCEMAVLNVSKQNSAFSILSSQKCAQLQKASTLAHDSSPVKSATALSVDRMPRAATDKKKVKLQVQPLGSVLRANRKTASAHEGNIIIGYQCPNCNKVFQTEWLMLKHSVTHFKYHCDICYQVYPSENMMKIHLLDHLSGAYEDEKYYCQFSCKICHSLKCGCYEPTYCKPQDLPRIFFRPQKAKRSKKGFISKLNSGPNDHLKISLSNYKKLIFSQSLGGHTKEKPENSAAPKPVLVEDASKVLVLKDDQKATNVGDFQVSSCVLREAQASPKPAEAPKVHDVERENQTLMPVKGETSHPVLTKERASDSIAGVSGEQSGKPSVSALEEKNAIMEREQQPKCKQVKKNWATKCKSDVTPPVNSTCVNKLEEAEDSTGTKRGGGRRRGTKPSNNFTYEDTDFYYMCEMCDAGFSYKTELSEHMFLHRLKSRSRRGEKRSISCVTEEKEVPKKVKVNEPQDKVGSKAAGGFESYECDLCHSTFSSLTDYRAHKILAHKEPKSRSQDTEAYRCNYCDKIYRRRRELKRHLKRDCVYAPSSLRGKSSPLLCSTDVIEESHYTKVRIDFEDKLDARTVGKGRGPIVCKYCMAVTKREAEMKRHIWKFCLKVPTEVVKKFMDGASLEELGFKFTEDRTSTEGSPKESPQRSISGMQNDIKDSPGEVTSVEIPDDGNKSSPEKNTSLEMKTSGHLMLPETSNTTKRSLQMSPDKDTSPAGVSKDSRMVRKTSISQDVFEDSSTKKPSLEKEAPNVQAKSFEEQNIRTTNAEESKKTDEAAKEQTPTKSPLKETKMELSCTADEAAQPTASTSPLACPVMQFPIVLPVMATAKSKRPLVCGYCGIWYFREMAILKHMKERCIKIPDFEKELLKTNSTLCNVPHKLGVGGGGSENGAMYKMVKVPEHLQNTPVPMPKDISNEDIKELNTSIKAYSESAPVEAKPVSEPENTSPSTANQVRNTSGKRGLRCRRCHEHFSSPETVLAHSSVHHGPKKGFYKCKLCHARMAKYKQLREHVWEHTNENPYRCHLCEVRYRSSDALVEHLQTLHQFTSINDKNLYKWLPGRHGKYRDIKDKKSSCEEKLDDIDTNLDSVAEVMVITDKDICSTSPTTQQPKKGEGKTTESCSDVHEQSDYGENVKEKSENLQVDLNRKENSTESNCKLNETKTPPANADVTSNTDCTDSNISKDKTAEKRDDSAEGENNAIKDSSEEVSYGTSSLGNTTVQEKCDDEEQTSTDPVANSESESGCKEQKEMTITEAMDVDRDSELGSVDGFTGEGLLPLVENLESVVETIQLTDKHLS